MLEIRKYPNRRLYANSHYITLADVRAFLQQGETICVRMHKGRRNITREVLLDLLKDRELTTPRLAEGDLVNMICAQ
jgi:polyhydroxyalkanoate synthesis regulator protein